MRADQVSFGVECKRSPTGFKIANRFANDVLIDDNLKEVNDKLKELVRKNVDLAMISILVPSNAIKISETEIATVQK